MDITASTTEWYSSTNVCKVMGSIPIKVILKTYKSFLPWHSTIKRINSVSCINLNETVRVTHTIPLPNDETVSHQAAAAPGTVTARP